MWLRVFLFVIFCALTVPPGAVYAEDDSARAIEMIAAANKQYDAGDFRSALEKYREAYALTEDPRVLYRIGVTYENLANYQRAREHLELYLLAEPDSKYSGRVKSKVENLRKLEANLQATIQLASSPDAASVWVNSETGRPAGVTPVRLPVGPGQHQLILKKEGFEDLRVSVTVGAGETVEKSFDLGTGAAVAGATIEPPPNTTDKPATTPTPQDAAIFAGQPSRVRIGPSTGVSVLSWISMGVGWALVATSGIILSGAFYTTAEVSGGALLLGAGLIGLGGYFLWFHDHTRHLPNKTAAHLLGVPNGRAFSVGLRF